MSLGKILYKLGVGRTPRMAEETAASLIGAAKNPSATALGALKDKAEWAARKSRPNFGVMTEFYDNPKPIIKQLDNASGDAMRDWKSGKGDWTGLGGRDVEYLDMDKDWFGGKYNPTKSKIFDKLVNILGAGEEYARSNPYALEAAAAMGGGSYYMANKRKKEMRPLEKLKMKLEGL